MNRVAISLFAFREKEAHRTFDFFFKRFAFAVWSHFSHEAHKEINAFKKTKSMRLPLFPPGSRTHLAAILQRFTIGAQLREVVLHVVRLEVFRQIVPDQDLLAHLANL